ncbi:hypothetical protein B0H19DRAFT_1366402 [Mycena capillaripes]|nr:hypothetical protein B0H19DRAFT_1366402 [Mycena capillaripes]
MDPITATTTLITLASFIKDLIELGQSIKRSIEKVSENRRRIRDLTDDVLHTLADLANLTRGHEDTFGAPALLSALGNLKEDMLHVLSICRKISPAERGPGFGGLKTQIKAWVNRDDIEKKIGRLKEHVNKCYLQFTTFSTARIEQTTVRVEDTALRTEKNTLRVEQRLIVDHVENQVRLRRLEGLMAQLLLETQFGQNVLSKTVEIIASDATHQTLEFQYLSAEAFRLIDSIQKLVPDPNDTSTSVPDTPLWDDHLDQGDFNGPASPKQVLHDILAMVLQINHCPARMLITSFGAFLNLGLDLNHLKMFSEATAWELMKIQTMHRLSGRTLYTGVLLHLALASRNLAQWYQNQLRWDRAVETSQKAADMCHSLYEIYQSADYWPLYTTVLCTHSDILRGTGRLAAALSVAQEAVGLCPPLETLTVDQSTEAGLEPSSLSVEGEFKVAVHVLAVFTLAKAFSSVDRHLEAYEAWKEGFQTRINMSKTRSPPPEKDIDSFLHQMCRVAERLEFSLSMLADCVVLFGDLARVYPENFSSRFLPVLHAYLYYCEEDIPQNFGRSLRIFLEPNPDRPPPELDLTIRAELSAFDGIIENAIRAYYTCPSHTADPLIRKIFISHFESAMVVLREVLDNSSFESPTIQWVLHSISNIVPSLSHSNRIALLQLMTNTVGHIDTILVCRGSRWELFLDAVVGPILHHLWRAGLLDEALLESEQIIRYLECRPGGRHVTERLWFFRGMQAFILCDLGRLSDAIEMIQNTERMNLDSGSKSAIYDTFFLHPCIIKTRILRRTGRNQHALQFLRKGVADGTRYFLWTSVIFDFDLALYFLLVELAATSGQSGQLEKALNDAERAVDVCRESLDGGKLDQRICVLVHALTTLSNCLAAVGRNDKALAVSQEALLIYSRNAPHMWEDFLYTIRKQELGANTFHSLSLRLATSGQLDHALINAEKATELYRELVGLAPRHLPTLASSLRNLASTLWRVDRRDESVAACEEAVGIMRKVVRSETYFLPALAEALDQMTDYLAERGDITGASAAAAECAEIREKFASLPPEPDFLFDSAKIEEGWESDEEEEDGEESWETASEEYNDTTED